MTDAADVAGQIAMIRADHHSTDGHSLSKSVAANHAGALAVIVVMPDKEWTNMRRPSLETLPDKCVPKLFPCAVISEGDADFVSREMVRICFMED